MDFDTFNSYCEKKKCLRRTILSNRCSKETKRQKCYDKFELSKNKEVEIDEKWEKVKREVYKRDSRACRFFKVLNPCEGQEARSILDSNLWSDFMVLDYAHVFGRGAYPHMKYDVDNVVMMTRYFHLLLDQYKNPFTSKSMGREEHDAWWCRIVGEDLWNKLLKKSKGLDLIDK
jgi:hypothetical protein